MSTTATGTSSSVPQQPHLLRMPHEILSGITGFIDPSSQRAFNASCRTTHVPAMDHIPKWITQEEGEQIITSRHHAPNAESSSYNVHGLEVDLSQESACTIEQWFDNFPNLTTFYRKGTDNAALEILSDYSTAVHAENESQARKLDPLRSLLFPSGTLGVIPTMKVEQTQQRVSKLARRIPRSGYLSCNIQSFGMDWETTNRRNENLGKHGAEILIGHASQHGMPVGTAVFQFDTVNDNSCYHAALKGRSESPQTSQGQTSSPLRTTLASVRPAVTLLDFTSQVTPGKPALMCAVNTIPGYKSLHFSLGVPRPIWVCPKTPGLSELNIQLSGDLVAQMPTPRQVFDATEWHEVGTSLTFNAAEDSPDLAGFCGGLNEEFDRDRE